MKVFDSHLHIIDTKFPLIENQGFMPDAFTCADYLHSVSNINILGGAVVSGSFQGYDQSYLIDAVTNPW
ncbi:2-pyrone-4,6-dicarboxylate hydrolase [Peribacillus sp. FSL K6-1552]|uniref:2-pyrone-4,6-dicarboxylate hydrolase n=1 Tax=Peribacillus TaxID=2675229 RepID=UPI0030FC2A11